jgi:predicted TIM-barrel fold metal-dependent hydrolase
VLFGSDWPLFDLAFSHANWVRFVKEQPWGDETMKERLFGDNFARLMRR